MNPDQFKARLKAKLVRLFLSYDENTLLHTLRRLGVSTGDTLMVHASWHQNNGFLGRPVDFINALKTAVGPEGLLVMTSLTYQNESSKTYLRRMEPMNVRRSPSRMGLLTEVFRRGRDTVRSLSPTHPLLAWGQRATLFIQGHDNCLAPFGPQSPFARLHEWGAKILTVDAPFSTITYTHFIEDRVSATLPFKFYEPEPMTGIIIDYEGRQHQIPTLVISDKANGLRREERLVAELEQASLLRATRVGNTKLLLIDAKAMADHVDAWTESGGCFFDPA